MNLCNLKHLKFIQKVQGQTKGPLPGWRCDHFCGLKTGREDEKAWALNWKSRGFITKARCPVLDSYFVSFSGEHHHMKWPFVPARSQVLKNRPPAVLWLRFDSPSHPVFWRQVGAWMSWSHQLQTCHIHSHSWYCFHDTMWSYVIYWPFAGWIAWSQWRDYCSFSEVRIAPTIRWNGPQFCTIFGDSRADKFPNWDASPTFPAHVVKFEGHFAEALAPLMERLGPKNRNGLVGSVSNVAGEVPVSWETEMGNQTQDDRIDIGLIQDCIHVTLINPPASKIAINCDFLLDTPGLREEIPKSWLG